MRTTTLVVSPRKRSMNRPTPLLDGSGSRISYEDSPSSVSTCPRPVSRERLYRSSQPMADPATRSTAGPAARPWERGSKRSSSSAGARRVSPRHPPRVPPRGQRRIPRAGARRQSSQPCEQRRRRRAALARSAGSAPHPVAALDPLRLRYASSRMRVRLAATRGVGPGASDSWPSLI